MAGAAGGSDPAGVWRYQKGGFGDDLTLTADGRAASALDPSNGGRWQMEGETLVIRWQNGWTNRYRVGDGNGPFGGVDVDPQGASQEGGTLTRVAGPGQTAVSVVKNDLGDGLTQYWVSHAGQGAHELPMPGHRVCALSYVASGGFNSACMIKKVGRDWVLVTVDPVEPGGQTQGCAAICYN